ncbi:MAG: TolC family protein [Opitutae bacterium]|nr:TolC family protein [Opitutae bacterium]
MTTSRISLSVFLLLSAGTALPAEPLTLDGAIARAFAHNRDLAAAGLNAEAARGRVDQAGLRPNPTLDTGLQSDLLTGNDGGRKLDLGLSQARPLGNRLKEAQAAARVGVASAGAELADRRRRLAGAIAADYVEIFAVDRQVALRDRLLAVGDRLVDLAGKRAKLGEVSALEVTAVSLEQATLRQEKSILLAGRAARIQALKPLLGLEPAEDLEVAGDLAQLLPAPDSGAAENKSAWRRPDRRAAELAIERVEAEQRVARAEVRGDLTVGAGYQYERSPGGGGADHLLGVRFSVPLPVRNKNQGRLRELRAEHTRAERELAALDLTIASEVAAARQKLGQYQKILDDYRRNVVPLAATAETELANAYAQGQVGIFQLIQNQQQRLALQAGEIDALAALARAAVELQTATGLNPHLSAPPADAAR